MNRTDILYLFAAVPLALCTFSCLSARPLRFEKHKIILGMLLLMAALGAWTLFAARQAAFWRMAAAPVSAGIVFGALYFAGVAGVADALCDAAFAYAAAQLALSGAGKILQVFGLEKAPLWQPCFVAGICCLIAAGGITLLRHTAPAGGIHSTRADAVCAFLIAAGITAAGCAGGEYPLLPTADRAMRAARLAQLLVCGGAVLLLAAQRVQGGQTELQTQKQQLESSVQSRYRAFERARTAQAFAKAQAQQLEHELSILCNEPNPAEMTLALQRARQQLRRAAAQNTTGNEALDVLLTDAGVRCAENGICFTALAEGETLAFLPQPELCMLVGGMLEIAVGRAATAEKSLRAVSFRVGTQGAFAFLTVEYPSVSKMQGSILKGKSHNAPDASLTAQENCALQAARLTVSRYGGGLAVKEQNQTACMRAILPLSALTPAKRTVDL